MLHFTSKTTQEMLLRMAKWHEQQSPNLYPESLSYIDALILVELDRNQRENAK